MEHMSNNETERKMKNSLVLRVGKTVVIFRSRNEKKRA